MKNEALFKRTQLPRPEISIADSALLFQEYYGLTGDICELGSQQDRNFRIEAPSGRFVLKICLSDYDGIELQAQNAAMRHIAQYPDGPRVPRVMTALSGTDIVQVDINRQGCQLRLLDYLDGEPLTRRKYLPPETIAALGHLAGKTAQALAGFAHPGLDRALQWDARRSQQVLQYLLAEVAPSPEKSRIERAMLAAQAEIRPLMSQFRTQPVHHDVTDDNVVSCSNADGVPMPFGVIDFGDVMNGWLVGDLAVTCSSLLHHAEGDAFAILPAIVAYHACQPLNPAELTALWPLIIARAAILVASSEQQLVIDPDNAYVQANITHERVILDMALTPPIALMQAAILQSVGLQPAYAALPVMSALVPAIAGSTIQIVDLSVTSDVFDGQDWRAPGFRQQCLADMASHGRPVATLYGAFELTETRILSSIAPATYTLFADLIVPQGTEIRAPFTGEVFVDGQVLTLSSPALTLFLSGIDVCANGMVVAGTPLGVVADPKQGLRIQLCRVPGLVPPPCATAVQAKAWASLCPSPSLVLGVNVDACAIASEALLEQRNRHFARPQKNYYTNPPQIERGLKEHMFDVEGRAYLDMVNNVTILGHAHPKLAKAVNRQWQRLNTNSRFHYEAVAAFSQRLADLAPEGLDTVFLVNSGSEAVDLALRLAWAASGRRNMLCLLEAYHGWTVASDAVSTSIADNPQALSTRPGWVHPIVSPNTYRGPFRGGSTTGSYVATVMQTLSDLDARGERPGGFICEPVYGNAGGIPLPEGYLQAVYAAVRARGGLCIADEVQVGYGRLGHYFWGFEQQGVVPDIITVAKGMGNGHPLGAVITSKPIADALEREGYFFSSAGGSPVSSVVGMTVLDIMEDESLQANARIIGTHLKNRLQALGQRFAIVGAVHGIGLYLGLEFVRDRTTLEPATQETMAICNRLLDKGVIMQPTGDDLNVLKIKPPLCLSEPSADFFVDRLAEVLEDLCF